LQSRRVEQSVVLGREEASVAPHSRRAARDVRYPCRLATGCRPRRPGHARRLRAEIERGMTERGLLLESARLSRLAHAVRGLHRHASSRPPRLQRHSVNLEEHQRRVVWRVRLQRIGMRELTHPAIDNRPAGHSSIPPLGQRASTGRRLGKRVGAVAFDACRRVVADVGGTGRGSRRAVRDEPRRMLSTHARVRRPLRCSVALRHGSAWIAIVATRKE